MSYLRDQKPATAQAPIDMSETTGAGPLAPQGATPVFSYRPKRTSMRSRLEKVGYWIVVIAAIALLLVLLKVFLPPLIGGMFTALFAGLFVSLLILMNIPRPAGWANTLLGRKVFPVLRAPDSDIWRLAGVNGLLVFFFTVAFHVIAYFVGPFFGGVLVFAAIVAAAVFYNRVRAVVIKP